MIWGRGAVKTLDLRDLAKELDDLRDADELDEAGADRLAALEELEGQLFTDMGSYAQNESTLIAEDSFVQYAQELADDLGRVVVEWPLYCIDWERAADDLKQDYAEVTFEGDTYLIRNY